MDKTDAGSIPRPAAEAGPGRETRQLVLGPGRSRRTSPPRGPGGSGGADTIVHLDTRFVSKFTQFPHSVI